MKYHRLQVRLLSCGATQLEWGAVLCLGSIAAFDNSTNAASKHQVGAPDPAFVRVHWVAVPQAMRARRANSSKHRPPRPRIRTE
jgi:hypothetical protein